MRRVDEGDYYGAGEFEATSGHSTDVIAETRRVSIRMPYNFWTPQLVRYRRRVEEPRDLMRDDNNAPHYFHVATYNLQQRRRSRKARDDPDRMATSRTPFTLYQQSDLPRNPSRDRRHRYTAAPAYLCLHGPVISRNRATTVRRHT